MLVLFSSSACRAFSTWATMAAVVIGLQTLYFFVATQATADSLGGRDVQLSDVSVCLEPCLAVLPSFSVHSSGALVYLHSMLPFALTVAL